MKFISTTQYRVQHKLLSELKNEEVSWTDHSFTFPTEELAKKYCREGFRGYMYRVIEMKTTEHVTELIAPDPE